MGAEDIGTWYAFLEIMSTLAVVSNMALFAFTGDQLKMWSWKERVIFFLVIEHVILALKQLVAMVSETCFNSIQKTFLFSCFVWSVWDWVMCMACLHSRRKYVFKMLF